jgi:signal transduction histidine kinase
LISAALLSGLLAFSTLQSLRGLIARTKELETESKLRQEAESTLFQVQKMEAVGQLTGGIAHDFNNLLTIILGNLDTVRRYLLDLTKNGAGAELRPKLTQPVDAAVQGAKSAAQLTQRLLAFSRRQTRPSRIDANRLVSGMLDMLGARRRRYQHRDRSRRGRWPSFADPHHGKNVLLNLALNAGRDADWGG